MVTLNAHFDGKVIVPDEPPGLAPGTRVRITIEPVEPPASSVRGKFDLPLLTGVDPEIVRAAMEDPELRIGSARIDQFLRPDAPEKPR